MKKILLTRWAPEEARKPYSEKYEIICPPKERPFQREELLARLPECDVLFGISTKPLDRQLMEAGSKLSAIGTMSVGYDHVDMAAANELGLPVVNTPHAVTEPTAELAIVLMMDIMRNITTFDKEMRRGEWTAAAFPSVGVPVFGSTLGIIGFGRIGSAVARKAQGLGMKVLYYKRHRLPQADEKAQNVTYADLDTILRESDCISLNMPMSEENRHLINAETLKKMKPTAFLVNTARGAIVDEAALAEALKNGTIRGAALDVFEKEPGVSEVLRGLDNVVMTPHVGTNAYASRVAMFRECMDGLTQILEGKHPDNVINPQVWG